MITAIDVNERNEYILEKERGAENPTIFVLRPLTAAEYLKTHSAVNIKPGETKADVEKRINTDELMSLTIPSLALSVVEIKNIQIGKGKEPVNITEISENIIKTLPLEVITELYTASLEMNQISGEEEKN